MELRTDKLADGCSSVKEDLPTGGFVEAFSGGASAASALTRLAAAGAGRAEEESAVD